jgi:transposase InsO family protein
MREKGLSARRKRRFCATTDSKHEDPIAPNLLARAFTVDVPNRVWVTDVTAIDTRSGWVFLAAILELYSRRVVGWALSTVNDTALALAALGAAVALRRPLPGLIHHSDRGSPYASQAYRDALKSFGMIASMSRKGDCWDNAVAESLWATVKAELVTRETYVDRAHVHASLDDYFRCFYNPQRRHSHLGYISPIEYELRCANPVVRA